MKKIIITVLSLLIFSLLLSACQPAAPAQPAPAGSAKLPVVATTTIVADVVRQVGGDKIELTALLPVGADPHSFEARPQDAAALSNATLIFANGAHLEEFLDALLQSANATDKLVEVSEGITLLEMEAHDHEHEGEDHSPEAHSGEVCGQLEGKTAEEEIQAGTDIGSAVELHGESHAEGAEHAHAREIITLKLNSQSDGTFAGYVLFDSEEEQGYAFTAASGKIAVTDATGANLEAAQILTIDCANMTVGSVYELPAGEYVVSVTGAASESVVFSAAPMHAHEHEAEGVASEEEHTHEGGDPHTWVDPNNVMIWTENIATALSQADPANAEFYRANADAYLSELKTLDAWVREQVSQILPENRKLVTDHRAWGYFADEYGFEQIGALVGSFSTVAQTSSQDLAALEDTIRAQGVKAVFVGRTVNPQLAEQVAKDTGIQVVYLYTGSLTAPDGEAPNYLSFIRYNVTAMVAALK